MILNNAGKNLEKLLVSLYTFYFPSRSNYFKIFFSVEDTRYKIQKFKLNRKKETSVLNLNFIIGKEQVRNVNINVTSGNGGRIEHSRSNVRHARGVEWLLACRDPAKTGREFEARRGNKVEGETFRTEYRSDRARPGSGPAILTLASARATSKPCCHIWPWIGSTLKKFGAAIRWENFDDNLIIKICRNC